MNQPLNFPMISIADLERDLVDAETIDEWETADTVEVPVPTDDDLEGPTGVYEIGAFRCGVEVYWVQRM